MDLSESPWWIHMTLFVLHLKCNHVILGLVGHHWYSRLAIPSYMATGRSPLETCQDSWQAQSWPPRHIQNTICCSWNSLSAAAIEAGSGNHTENRQQNSYENFRIQIWKKLNYTLHSIFKKIKINKWQRPAFGTRSWGKKTHQYNTPITEDPLIAS